MTRRFPSPWVVEEIEACFIVRDVNGQALAMSISRTSQDGDRRRTGSPATRPGASRRTSPSCRNS